MKLINKEKFTVQNIDETKLTSYNFKTNFILIHEGEIPDTDFIKNLKRIVDSEGEFIKVGRFFTAEIIEKPEQDKEVVRDHRKLVKKIKEFKDYSFMVIVRDDYIKSGGKYEKFTVDLSAEIKDFKEIERIEEVDIEGEMVEKIVPYKKVWLQKLNIEDGFDLVEGVVTTSLDLEITQNPTYEFKISDAYLKTRVIIKKEES